MMGVSFHFKVEMASKEENACLLLGEELAGVLQVVRDDAIAEAVAELGDDGGLPAGRLPRRRRLRCALPSRSFAPTSSVL